MRVVFLGTPDFAVLALRAINSSKHQVVGVVTQPDRPVGRKGIITPCATKVEALNLNLQVFSYEKISKEGVQDIKNLNADILVTCAFGQILSQEILDIAKHGVINIHASLLPKYRGSAPIQYSIINGDSKTGVTIMQTELGVDTGDILMQESIDILENETAGELFDRLSVLGAEMIVKALDDIENNKIAPIKQDEEKANTQFGLSMRTGNIGWRTKGETLFFTKDGGTYTGITNYNSDNTSFTPTLNFCFYHSQNLTKKQALGELKIRFQVMTPIDDLNYNVSYVDIDITLSTATETLLTFRS